MNMIVDILYYYIYIIQNYPSQRKGFLRKSMDY